MLSDLLRAAHEGAATAVRQVVHHVATVGDVRRLWWAIRDLNTRVAAMEPHGPCVGACRLCTGPLHVCVRDALLTTDDGVTFKRTLLKCARCGMVRPIDSPTGDAPAGEVGY